MSSLEEPRIRCPSCGKLTPPMKYCIHCGAKLPQVGPATVRPPSPTFPPPLPPSVPPPTRVTPAPPSVEVKDEIGNLMSGITVLFERKIALLDLSLSGQVSETIFLKLHKEYRSKLKDLLNMRASKMGELRSKLSEGDRRLSEVAMRLEELEVRRKLGEVDANVYSQGIERLKAEERELNDSVKTLKMNIDRLEKVLAEKKPGEISELETKLRSFGSIFEKLLEEGKISAETLSAVRPDIEETLRFFDSLIKDRKEREKDLREQLETLQTRYKLSELSIEEYEKRKRELQTEMDKVWA